MSVTNNQIQNAFKEFQKEHNYNVPVKLVIKQSQEDLYGQEYSYEKTGIRIEAEYRASKNEIRIFSRAIRDNRHLKQSIRHELLGHYGINTLEPYEKRILLDRIIDARNEPTLKPVWETIDRVYKDQAEYRKAEEVFAFVAEIDQSRIIPPRTQLTDWTIQSQDNQPLNIFELRTISEVIDNGIIAGIRKQRIFPEDDFSQFRATDDLTSAADINKRLSREEQALLDAQKQLKAAFLAKEVLREALPVMANHPYLDRKKINPEIETWNYLRSKSGGGFPPELIQLYELDADKLKSIINYAPRSSKNGEYLKGRILIAPVGDATGITSLEFIDENGLKSALASGRKSGAYYEPDFINHRANQIYIVEGVSTGLSVREATKDQSGSFVASALSSTNLKKTISDLHSMFESTDITVCAEIGNGYMQAKKAVAEINWEDYKAHKNIDFLNIYITQPEFTPQERLSDNSVPSDFNDLWQLRPDAVLPSLSKQKLMYLPKDQADANKEIGDIFLGILKNEASDNRNDSQTRQYLRDIENTYKNDYEKIGLDLRSATGLFTDDVLEKFKTVKNITAFIKAGVRLEIDDLRVENHQVLPIQSTHNDNRRKNMDAGQASSRTAVTEDIKVNAALIYGQGTQVYPAKPGAIYKGDIVIFNDHILQEIGKNSVILHDKSKVNYISDEFQKLAEKIRRPDVAIYYQDKQGKATETATAYPYSRAKDDLDRVVAGLKKSAKDLNLPNLEGLNKTLDQLADRSWARNQEIRKEVREAKIAERQTPSQQEPSKPSKSPKR